MNKSSPVTDGMIRIHKLISRSLKVAIAKSEEYLGKKSIPSGESEGFLMYIKTLGRVMHGHHMGEDDIVFPYLTGRVEAPYEKLRGDHVAIAKLLDDFEKKVTAFSYENLESVRKILTEIDRLWEPHIKIEEITLTSAALENILTEKEQKGLMDRVSQHGQKSSGPGPTTLPFVMYNLDTEDRKEFVKDFPWILKSFLVPVVWRKKWKPMDPFLLN